MRVFQNQKILCEKKSPLRWWKNQNNFQGIISICSEAVIMSFPIFRSGFPCIGLNLQLPNFNSHLFHSLLASLSLSFFVGQYVHCMRRWVHPAIWALFCILVLDAGYLVNVISSALFVLWTWVSPNLAGHSMTFVVDVIVRHPLFRLH